MTQPAVSMSVRGLEQTLGGERLFRRRGRRVELTPLGHQLIGPARQLLGLADEKDGVRLMKPFTKEILVANMFHANFKMHLKAIDTLAEEFSVNPATTKANLDLILKWATIRFFVRPRGNETRRLCRSANAFLSSSGHTAACDRCRGCVCRNSGSRYKQVRAC